MNALRVVPAYRHGRERLYVCRPDGSNVAWYDREAARVNLLGEDSRDDVLQALKPFLTGPVTVGPPSVPTPAELARLTLHPDDDLAPNRPGEALLVALDRDPGPAHRLRPDPRRRALTAEQTVGEALDRLEGAGWHTLHSVPLPGGDRIHHLLLGPGGVFAVHALYARKTRILVADPMVTVGRREAEPLLRRLRADADRASYALTAEVRPVLALAGPAEVTATAPPRAVRILQDTELAGLARSGGVLKPADVEALHGMARDRNTWGRL
ncbi:nuclease-related domain-containing protein [Streptomyces broussonetiae]|uniref:NERD domain-containing protein n=1 Tax=Streptomyces broussonetiae TaxID=2686304 RepID=A0A6I6N5P7_9ACTN|nr:nuclease-related domain-containing protein [Streptomyces broussonetiae]QHA06812.1 NERD domain-containing protein [Streptomyces broussonetiae]